jgi:hypothetical protein
MAGLVIAMTRHLVTTRAAPRACKRCKASILVAVSEGLPAYVDTTPIDALQEIRALVEGRWTYTLTTARELLHRDRLRIQTTPDTRTTIHRQHRCPTTGADHE